MAEIKRVALIGCGAIAPTHIKAILAAGREICALCDIEPARAVALAEQYALPAAAIYNDYQRMLEIERPDAVHICTPHDLHAPMCIDALKKNIHVLCEKPLCITDEQLDAVIAAEKSSDAQLGVCLQNRYEPNMKRMRELCQNGVREGFGNVIWKRDSAYYHSGEWRGTWAHEGGGVMINQALHTLDLLQWVCGYPDKVTAHVATDHLSDVMETEDTAMARFSCKNGCVFHFFATVAAEADLPVQIRLRLENKAVLEVENELLVQNGGVEMLPRREATVGKREWGTGHRELVEDFYGAIERGEPFAIDAVEGARVVRMILAMYRSNGRQVPIL